MRTTLYHRRCVVCETRALTFTVGRGTHRYMTKNPPLPVWKVDEEGVGAWLCSACAMSSPVAHVASELGRRGGRKGGVARAAKLSPERRSKIAKAAAAKRWHGKAA